MNKTKKLNNQKTNKRTNAKNTNARNKNTKITANTPYDDVFRTLLNDCSELIFPLINEIFGEHYTGKETLSFSPNEHFLNQQDGEESERITDTSFRIADSEGTEFRKYHLECQSISDSSMLVRFYEYDTQIALDESELKKNVLTVTLPCSALLYLRHSAKTPDSLKIRMITPGGTLEYDIRVMKSQEYTLDEIFEKNLLLLIPFYIFTHEKRFRRYDADPAALQALQAEYVQIRERLENLAAQGTISEYIKRSIIDMSNKVVENIAKKHDPVKEGVKAVMGGKILDYEAKDILRKGIAQGEKTGFAQGQRTGFAQGQKIGEEKGEKRGISQGVELKLIQISQKKLRKGKTAAEIAEDLEEPLENIVRICKAVQNCKSEDPQEIYRVLTEEA